jgi:sugar O-acyltransferase (sialic acid O-acetyltransferase NeuD family)
MNKHEKVYILGGGGHAKVVIATLRAAGFTRLQVLDDNELRRGQRVLDVPITGPLTAITKADIPQAIIAIGDNRKRREIAKRFDRVTWLSVVHPTACIDRTATLGPGGVVFAGAIIQPETRIGAHAIINTGATIDHDCRIGDYAHLAPGCHLCGNVELGEGALLGVGSAIIPGKHVGAWTTVGAGAVIVNDLPSGVIAVGNPAQSSRGQA